MEDYIDKIQESDVTYDIRDARVPDGIPQKYLHINEEGQFEWVDVNDGGSSAILDQDLFTVGFIPTDGAYYRHTGETGSKGTPLCATDTVSNIYFNKSATINAVKANFEALVADNPTPNGYMEEEVAPYWNLITSDNDPILLMIVCKPAMTGLDHDLYMLYSEATRENPFIWLSDDLNMGEGFELSAGWQSVDKISFEEETNITCLHLQYWTDYVSKAAYTTLENGTIYCYENGYKKMVFDVDTELSDDSENPVASKTVKKAIEDATQDLQPVYEGAGIEFVQSGNGVQINSTLRNISGTNGIEAQSVDGGYSLGVKVGSGLSVNQQGQLEAESELPQKVASKYLHTDANGDLEWADVDSLPQAVNDKYLHVNSNGVLEWADGKDARIPDLSGTAGVYLTTNNDGTAAQWRPLLIISESVNILGDEFLNAEDWISSLDNILSISARINNQTKVKISNPQIAWARGYQEYVFKAILTNSSEFEEVLIHIDGNKVYYVDGNQNEVVFDEVYVKYIATSDVYN